MGGITFIGKAANSVVSSQPGVVSISVRNSQASGSVQLGLAQDTSPNFDTGKSIVLPYKLAKGDDIITVATQAGHAKVFVNHQEEPAEDLGAVGDILLAKVILDQEA